MGLFRFSPTIDQVLRAGQPVDERTIQHLIERDRRLEEFVSVVHEMTFNLRGALTVSESDPWPSPGGRVKAARSALNTAGSATSTVVVKVNGATAITISLATGVVYQRDSGAMDAPPGAEVSVAVTTAGAAAAGLVVVVEFE